jgi:hypothetical protein
MRQWELEKESLMSEQKKLKDYWESLRDSAHGRLEPCCFLIRNFYGASKRSQED